MTQDDRIRLQHMRDATKEVLSFVEGKQREDVYEDRMLLLALSRE